MRSLLAWLPALCLAAFFLPRVTIAQPASGRTCGTPLADSLRRAEHPEAGSREEFEAWLARMMATSPSSFRSVVTLPVVVHVIHNGEAIGSGNNISFAQIQSQMEVLNEDFRRLPGTPGFNNHPSGADTEIEFCLATLDPAGQPLVEVGVHRVNRSDFAWNAPPYSMNYAKQTILPATQWDPDQYLNIWVMPLTSGLLGFAQTPDASTLNDLPVVGGGASTDGVVIRPTSFGRVGNVNPPFHKGRTLTHELGHWLGLIHTSGDGNCSADDGCSDTPPTDGQHYGCPAGTISCGQASMIENYLEYTDDACMNTFTICQKTRMLTVLEHSPRRGSLALSTKCSREVPPAAYFQADLLTLCEGQLVSFTDLSPNQPSSWSWSFPGGQPATSADQNPQVKYSQAGIYDVSLTVSNAFGSTQRTVQQMIVVNESGPSAFFLETFESGIPATWTIDNPDQQQTWTVREVEGQPGGTQAAWVNCYQYPQRDARDRLTTPALDLSGYTSVQLSFEHAYRRYADGTTVSDDSLLVWASTDNGATFPFLLAALGEAGGGEFATGPDTVGFFIPKRPSDWCFHAPPANCQTISLASFEGESAVRIAFEVVNDYGNAIYLDNVTLTGVCAITSVEEAQFSQRWQLYPNPAGDYLEVEGRELGGENILIEVLDSQGRVVSRIEKRATSGELRATFDTSNWAPGVYVVMCRSGAQLAVNRVIRR